MIVITFINTNGYCNKRNADKFSKIIKFLGAIKGVNRVTR